MSKKHLLLARKQKKFEMKLSTSNKIIISDVFKRFKKSILDSNNTKLSQEINNQLKIDYMGFEEDLSNALSDMIIKNIDKTITYYTEIYSWNITKKQILGIEDTILKNWTKKYAAKKVTKISETTKNILNKIISDNQGLSGKGLVKEILSKVDDMSDTRAATIARTETSSAINNTSLKTAKSAKMKKKRYIHIGGRYTSRDNHKRLNGKVIGIDEDFDFGTAKAPCPHHPTLPVSEIVNCNCLITFE